MKHFKTSLTFLFVFGAISTFAFPAIQKTQNLQPQKSQAKIEMNAKLGDMYIGKAGMTKDFTSGVDTMYLTPRGAFFSAFFPNNNSFFNNYNLCLVPGNTELTWTNISTGIPSDNYDWVYYNPNIDEEYFTHVEGEKDLVCTFPNYPGTLATPILFANAYNEADYDAGNYYAFDGAMLMGGKFEGDGSVLTNMYQFSPSADYSDIMRTQFGAGYGEEANVFYPDLPDSYKLPGSVDGKIVNFIQMFYYPGHPYTFSRVQFYASANVEAGQTLTAKVCRVEEGMINIDDPIAESVYEFPNNDPGDSIMAINFAFKKDGLTEENWLTIDGDIAIVIDGVNALQDISPIMNAMTRVADLAHDEFHNHFIGGYGMWEFYDADGTVLGTRILPCHMGFYWGSGDDSGLPENLLLSINAQFAYIETVDDEATEFVIDPIVGYEYTLNLKASEPFGAWNVEEVPEWITIEAEDILDEDNGNYTGYTNLHLNVQAGHQGELIYTLPGTAFTIRVLEGEDQNVNYDFKVDGICYKINSDSTSVHVTYEQMTIPRYINLSGAVTIPASVNYNGKTYSVESIKAGSFLGCTEITSIAIPNTLSSIGKSAFNNCNSLNELSLTGKGAWNYNSSQHLGLYSIINNIKTVNIGTEITALGNFHFSPNVVNCYATEPPTCQSSTFTSYDGELHVPLTSTVAYFTSNTWQNFNNLSNDLTEKVILNQIDANITQWGTVELNATTDPEGGNVKWTTSNPAIATVNDDGLVTALAGGECAIFATLETNPAVYSSCIVSASYPETTITLSYNEIDMKLGEDTTLVAAIVPDNTGLAPTWSSSNTSVATVKNGVVTAVGEGECNITATVLNSSATCHITVSYPEITITLSDESLEMNKGEEQTLTATINPDNLGLIPTWTSSNESVATVDNGIVTAVGNGECDIVATVLDKTASCHVTVGERVVITLSHVNSIIGVNQLLTVYPSCTPDVPVELVVTSSDPSVAIARLINRTKAPAEGLTNFSEKGMALNFVDKLFTPQEAMVPALAGEKAIMIVGVQNGTATITVNTDDGAAEPAILELRVIDVNGDLAITSSDITALYNYLLNGDQTYIATSDVNGDGNITSTDITVIYNILLGK